MDRYDFIETREDIVSNIRTLYSYLQGEQGDEYKSWAIEKMIRGKNYVVEIIDSMICFAPSRFGNYSADIIASIFYDCPPSLKDSPPG